MEKNKVTFFIVNNESGKTHKLVISLAWLKTVSFLLAVVVLIFAAGFIDYFGLLAQSVENKRLKNENVQLAKQFKIIESKVSSLESALERVKTFTTKLKLITNIDANDRLTKLTIGDQPANQQFSEEYEPVDNRASSDAMVQQDAEYAQPNEPNAARGEVSVEPSQRDYATLVVRLDRAVKESQMKEQSILDLWESLSERQSLLNSTPNIKPARGWITSRFGYRINPVTGKRALHAGLDVAASPGSPVYAPADGIVSFASYDETYGKLVSIDYGYGITTRFGHLSQIYVHTGQKVSKWDVVAAVGNTGRSTGPHLHYEVRLHDTPVDPANYILDE